MYGPKGVEQAYALQSLPRQQAGGEPSPEGCRHTTHTHTRRAFDPLGADDDGGTHPPRVRCAHPRLQSSATPAGPAASRICCTDVGMRTAVPQRHAAGMATGTASLPRFCSGMATRKAASQMLCTDIGMGTAVPPRHAAGMTAGTASLPRFCSGMATRTAAPRGPNYSVTAGEHGEPAEGEPHIYMYGPKGVEQAYALQSQPRQQAGGEPSPEGCRHTTHTHTR